MARKGERSFHINMAMGTQPDEEISGERDEEEGSAVLWRIDRNPKKYLSPSIFRFKHI